MTAGPFLQGVKKSHLHNEITGFQADHVVCRKDWFPRYRVVSLTCVQLTHIDSSVMICGIASNPKVHQRFNVIP